MEITLFGEKIKLVHLVGRKGMLYLPAALKVFRQMLEAMEPAQKRMTRKGASELVITAEAMTLVSDYIDENFVDNILPGLYVYSESRLSMKAAREKIDVATISIEGLTELFQAFVDAVNFWSTPEDREAFDEAVKKSKDVEVESEEEEESLS